MYTCFFLKWNCFSPFPQPLAVSLSVLLSSLFLFLPPFVSCTSFHSADSLSGWMTVQPPHSTTLCPQTLATLLLDAHSVLLFPSAQTAPISHALPRASFSLLVFFSSPISPVLSLSRLLLLVRVSFLTSFTPYCHVPGWHQLFLSCSSPDSPPPRHSPFSTSRRHAPPRSLNASWGGQR